jgi:hypothetical protein
MGGRFSFIQRWSATCGATMIDNKSGFYIFVRQNIMKAINALIVMLIIVGMGWGCASTAAPQDLSGRYQNQIMPIAGIESDGGNFYFTTGAQVIYNHLVRVPTLSSTGNINLCGDLNMDTGHAINFIGMEASQIKDIAGDLIIDAWGNLFIKSDLDIDGSAEITGTMEADTVYTRKIDFYSELETFARIEYGASSPEELSLYSQESPIDISAVVVKVRSHSDGELNLTSNAIEIQSEDDLWDYMTIDPNRMEIGGRIYQTHSNFDIIFKNDTVDGFLAKFEGYTDKITFNADMNIAGDIEMVAGTLCFSGSPGGLIEGEISGYNGGITLTSVAQGDWDQIMAFTVNGPSNVVDPNHVDDHIEIKKEGRYGCRWRWSGHGTAVAHDWEFLASKNNNTTMFTNTASIFTNLTTQKDVTVPGGGTILCDVGDTIEIWVRRNTPGNNIILTTETCWLYVVLSGGG